MTAVANATGLEAPAAGLGFPPVSADAIANVCRPAADGGALDHKGMVEVVTSLERDGSEVPHHLQWGVYVTYEGDTDYAAQCFREYHMLPDDTGRYAALYRPIHLIGLELGVSVAWAALRGEATGQATGWRADVVATAKRDLGAGEVLDGEGGYCVWGRIMPARDSARVGALPLGLANGVRLKGAVKQGDTVRWADVEIDETAPAVAFRREMEATFTEPAAPARASA
jgi:predicted homoserine dehydrogenase-like protein